MKCALKRLGRWKHDFMRPPLDPLDDAESARIDHALQKSWLIVGWREYSTSTMDSSRHLQKLEPRRHHRDFQTRAERFQSLISKSKMNSHFLVGRSSRPFFIPSAFLVVATLIATPSFAEPDRTGGERVIYRDPETGRTVWRMTVSKTNDKHCYYSDQPWSPDMKKILWSVGQPTDQSKIGAIWVMDADGSHFRKLVDNVPYNMHTGANPVWSPDGRQIYWGGSGACDLKGKLIQRPNEDEYLRSKEEYKKGPIHITNAMCHALSPHKKLLAVRPAAVRNPKWSPDNQTLMIGFSNEVGDPVTYKSTAPTVKELFLIDADGKNFRRLGDYGGHHSWVSDSKYVILIGQNNEGLVYQAIDGSSRRIVSNVTGTHPSVNPQLTMAVTDVYHDKTGPYKDYLVLIDLKNGRVEKLVKTPRTHARTHGWTHPNPSWSPDGSMIMYDSDESGVCQVYIVVVDEARARARFGNGAIAPKTKS